MTMTESKLVSSETGDEQFKELDRLISLIADKHSDDVIDLEQILGKPIADLDRQISEASAAEDYELANKYKQWKDVLQKAFTDLVSDYPDCTMSTLVASEPFFVAQLKNNVVNGLKQKGIASENAEKSAEYIVKDIGTNIAFVVGTVLYDSPQLSRADRQKIDEASRLARGADIPDAQVRAIGERAYRILIPEPIPHIYSDDEGFGA